MYYCLVSRLTVNIITSPPMVRLCKLPLWDIKRLINDNIHDEPPCCINLHCSRFNRVTNDDKSHVLSLFIYNGLCSPNIGVCMFYILHMWLYRKNNYYYFANTLADVEDYAFFNCCSYCWPVVNDRRGILIFSECGEPFVNFKILGMGFCDHCQNNLLLLNLLRWHLVNADNPQW